MKKKSQHNGGDSHRDGGLRNWFGAFARNTSEVVGSIWAFIAALGVIVVWAATGPLFAFSDTWQLVINTSTTIITFIMVFLIQSTQNRDAKAVHLKLDEIIRAVKGARNDMVDLENTTDEELEALAKEFAALHQRACAAVKSRAGSTEGATGGGSATKSVRKRKG